MKVEGSEREERSRIKERESERVWEVTERGEKGETSKRVKREQR